MKLGLRTINVVVLALICAGFCVAQNTNKSSEPEDPAYITSSAAFAEVLLRMSVLEAELEELLIRYADDFPRVAAARFELADLDASMRRIRSTGPDEGSKLTLALGKMLVQKAVYATELKVLEDKYKDSHPEVKRARRKLEIFEKAVNRIL